MFDIGPVEKIINGRQYPYEFDTDYGCMMAISQILFGQCHIWDLWRLWAEIEAHKWRDLELNLSKTVEKLSQDSQLIQANSKKKLRDNKKLLECSFAQI